MEVSHSFKFLEAKHPSHVGVGDGAYLFEAHAVGFCEPTGYLDDVGALVALASMGHGSHVGAVGLEDDAAEGHDLREHLGQMGLLEGEDATDAEHEAVELEELEGFPLVAREAMEHATGEVVLVVTEQTDHLVLCLATMDHQGQTHLHRPAHLLLEGFYLLALVLTAPVVVEPYLADGDDG